MNGKEDLKATAASAAIPESVSSSNTSNASLKRPPAAAVEPADDAGEVAITSVTLREPQRMATRARMNQGIQSFIKLEDIPEGNVQCPVCFQIILSSEKGCNVVTCRNHQPQFVYFCVHCKKVNENNTEYIHCDCPKRNTRTTRAQAQADRNNVARANPIDIDFSSSSDNEEEKHGEEEESSGAYHSSSSDGDEDDSSYDGDEDEEEKSDDEDTKIPARKKMKVQTTRKKQALLSSFGNTTVDAPGGNRRLRPDQEFSAEIQDSFIEVSDATTVTPITSIYSAKKNAKQRRRENNRAKWKRETAQIKQALCQLAHVPTVCFEFKFSSQTTDVFKAGDVQGRIHIQLSQDPITGTYRIPLGTTQFEVFFEKEETGGIWKDDKGFFRGQVNRRDNIGTKVGTDLVVDHMRNKTPSDWDRDITVRCRSSGGLQDTTKCHSVFSAKGANFRRWEKNQGGLWELRAIASKKSRTKHTYRIKLHTVLSAHKPNEKDSLKLYDQGHVPDWPALVSLVYARHPEREEAWPMRAVNQYKLFLDLKADKSLVGTELSPSLAIAEIWQTHLSFVERYQKDVLVLTKGERLIEHLPVDPEDAPVRYAATYQEHSKRMKEKGLPIVQEFWPNPVKPAV